MTAAEVIAEAEAITRAAADDRGFATDLCDGCGEREWVRDLLGTYVVELGVYPLTIDDTGRGEYALLCEKCDGILDRSQF